MTEVKIQDLEKCAGMLLMGCSSASLALNGDYPPVGPPLSYILAGSPNIVGTLWEVTDREIDRFTKALLKAFLDVRSTSLGCKQCSILAEEFKSMSVNERKGNTKKGRGRKKKPESEDGVLKASTGYCFTHKLRAGYFVSQARKACRLQFMIGAAPVCYGVPTGIRKKISV
uniref:Separase n=2 Tax=Opuntia streptacantha TaxID=393608 RepID=A0A7C9AXX5_OPUST